MAIHNLKHTYLYIYVLPEDTCFLSYYGKIVGYEYKVKYSLIFVTIKEYDED